MKSFENFRNATEAFGKKSVEYYREYLEELKANDPISVVSVYCKAKFRDHIAIFTESSFRSVLHDAFCKACRGITINKNDLLTRLDRVDKESKGEKHYEVVNAEINAIISQLRLINGAVEQSRGDNRILQEEVSSFSYQLFDTITKINQQIIPEYNEYKEQTNLFKLYDCNKSLSCTGGNIPYTEQYIICQYIGQRDINIGVYVGVRPDGKYYLVPLGTQVVIKNTTHTNVPLLCSDPGYFDNIEDLKTGIINTIYSYAFLLDRVKRPSQQTL